MAKSVEKRVAGEFNIGTARETSIVSLAKNLRDRVCPTAKVEFAPAKAGEQMRSVIDNTLAAKVLSWRPTLDMSVGLDRTLEWYRRKH